MKKLLIALSTLFIVACSDGDIGGYTESIIKGASAPESNASLEQQPSLLKKSSSPLDEDLSGLDEDELREKLMNSYPWPKPEGVAAPSSSSGSGESGSSSISIENTFDLPHNPNDAVILNFKWNDVAPVFAEPPNYEYGFDRDVEDKDPTVYISVEINGPEKKSVSFIPYLSSKAYDEYYLLNETYAKYKMDKYKKVISNGSFSSIEIADASDGGNYVLYGCKNNSKGKKTCQNAHGKVKNHKRINVVPFEKITKKMIYVPINGNDGTKLDDENEKCGVEGFSEKGFIKDCIEKNFNDVYKQAVIEGNVIQQKASDYGIYGLKEINMTTPVITKTVFFDKLIETAKEKIKQSGVFQKDLSGKLVINQDKAEYLHIIFAINKERKIWNLGDCPEGKYDLSACSSFHPEKEPKNIHYFWYDKYERQKKNAKIRVRQTIEDGIKKMHYYLEIEGKPFPYEFGKNDILETDDGYPVVPTEAGINGAVAGLSRSLEEKANDIQSYGSIVFVTKRVGKSLYNVLMHELGHSFGLTDVSRSSVYRITENALYTDEEETKQGINENGTIVPKTYSNLYASRETNLMTWQVPTGQKLRYRPMQVACTGGTKYYKKLKDGDGTFDEKEGSWGSVERMISGAFETNQWECIRGRCLDDPNYSTDERKEYFKREGRCFSNNKPNGDDKKNILSTYNDYTKDKDEKLKAVTINYDKEKKLYIEQSKDDLK